MLTPFTAAASAAVSTAFEDDESFLRLHATAPCSYCVCCLGVVFCLIHRSTCCCLRCWTPPCLILCFVAYTGRHVVVYVVGCKRVALLSVCLMYSVGLWHVSTRTVQRCANVVVIVALRRRGPFCCC